MSSFNISISKGDEEKARKLARSSEDQHWYDVMRTLLMYEDFSMETLKRRQEHMNRLSERQSSALPPEFFTKLEKIGQGMKANLEFLTEVAAFYNHCTNGANGPPPKNDGVRIRSSEQHRNKAVLHSVGREWSKTGEAERNEAFLPMIEELKRRLPVNKNNAYIQRVLVPGCGVARLPVEVSAEGYAVEGNEYSAFMLMASNYVMNCIEKANSCRICPWVDSVCNVINTEDPYTPVSIPDRTANDIVAASPWIDCDADERAKVGYPRLGMAAGDFVELYGEGNLDAKGSFDAILTCFFIDTAPVVVDYVDTIWHLLKPGGVWINLGPLLYHWTTDTDNNGDDRYDHSIELSWEELKYVVEGKGFQLQSQQGQKGSGSKDADLADDQDKVQFLNCSYSRPHNQLMWTQYNALFFTAIKPTE
jgi:carnosine N-methyltransferase